MASDSDKPQTVVVEPDPVVTGGDQTSDKNIDPESKPAAASTDRPAKAGKRSSKAQAAREAEADRLARHAARSQTDSKKPPAPVVKPRPRHVRRGRRYRQAYDLIDHQKVYDPKEAIDLILKTATTNFDSSVELAVALAVDVRQADQNIRDSVLLPAGQGKTVRVAVCAPEGDWEAAKDAGADIVGDEVFLQKISRGEFDFDVLIAPPKMMAAIGPYAKILGPKGLMPNPKSGTVTKDVAAAVKEAKAGRVEYRADETGVVHISIGRVSFGAEPIADNFNAVMTSLRSNKPASLKGRAYIKAIHIATTMGPSARVAISK